MVENMEKITIMILPVGTTCNLTCRYCYHGEPSVDRGEIKIIPSDILGKVVSQSKLLAKDIDFLWHGGEPLLAGMDFYSGALNFQKSTNFSGKARNIVQTNGTLINAEMAKFLASNHFFVGVSLDGPKEIHDDNRFNCIGGGSFEKVIKGIKNLHSLGRFVGAVAVVTKAGVVYPDEVYKALKNSGVKTCAFHLYSKSSLNSFDLFLRDEDACFFLKRVFDLWIEEDDPDFMVRNFRNVLRVLFGGKALDCASNHNYCRRFIAIIPNGNVYPCHRFVGMENFLLGNVQESPLQEIYKRGANIYDDMASVPESCFSCNWFRACGGGCAYERLAANKSFCGKHPECEIKRELFSHIEKSIK